MTGKLRHTLVVRHPDTHEATALLAGEPVPSWAKGLVQSGDVEGDESKKAAPKRSDSK